MRVSKISDRCFQAIFDFINKTIPNWDKNKISTSSTVLLIILPMLIIYYLILSTEWMFSLIIYRHAVKFDIEAELQNEEIEKWLTDNCRWNSKYMNYTDHDVSPFKHLKNEVRFIRKKDAALFKLVWG